MRTRQTMVTITPIMVMQGIIITVIITIMALQSRPALFHGDAWGGLRCWWRLPLPLRAWCR